MTKGKLGYSWIDARITALIRKKEILYHKARRSNDDSLTSRYKRLRAYVQKEIRDADWRYVFNILTHSETDTNIEGCYQNDRPKRFCSFMKKLRNHSSDLSCLRDNGILKSGNKDTSDIFSRQFGPVYTREKVCDLPSKEPSPLPDIEDISIYPNGSGNVVTVPIAIKLQF